MKMKPILFLNPVFVQRIWGGNRLKTQFGYEIPSEKIGECWGVSAHAKGDCVVREGIYQGMLLSTLWKEHPELFGYCDFERFPLLTKIIDSTEACSIQVHPDDDYAREHENGSFGKMECWYVLDCHEDTKLVLGHNATSREELGEMIRQGKWSEFIREVPIKKGDFIQIDAGCVHAITAGLMVLETQQNSDITYRIYDYGRLENGKQRPMHVEQSIDVITVPAPMESECIKHAGNLPVNCLNELISCEYYEVWKIDVEGSFVFLQEQLFLIMSIVEGEGSVNGHPVCKGDHFILPYEFGEVKLEGNMTIIASSVNKERGEKNHD